MCRALPPPSPSLRHARSSRGEGGGHLSMVGAGDLGPWAPCSPGGGGAALCCLGPAQHSLQVSLDPSECPDARQKALTPVSTYSVSLLRPPVLLPPPQGALVSWLEWPVTGFAGQSRAGTSRGEPCALSSWGVWTGSGSLGWAVRPASQPSLVLVLPTLLCSVCQAAPRVETGRRPRLRPPPFSYRLSIFAPVLGARL